MVDGRDERPTLRRNCAKDEVPNKNDELFPILTRPQAPPWANDELFPMWTRPCFQMHASSWAAPECHRPLRGHTEQPRAYKFDLPAGSPHRLMIWPSVA